VVAHDTEAVLARSLGDMGDRSAPLPALRAWLIWRMALLVTSSAFELVTPCNLLCNPSRCIMH
jgi:hypothetical protein